MKWIKTSEQLPEMEVPVLAGWFSEYRGKFVWHCFLRSDPDGEGWIWSISTDNFLSDENWFVQDDDYPITHWMPLPQPPQQEVKSALEIGMSRYAGAMQKLAEGGD